ncbi:hypothetical protein M885DRAFT_543424 [Pelagophyceae sp. CCMP2097]|nr:hypothetical protein M885DRAFT_543424 [Pelagophyceae sp. CCMP2097]|mmetsp:Transcript_32734/g.110254  ORF Transcript_32734/g.110254 Transcript_32734/m.110254 type:complete len:261 (+) Transcript_32734:64-846(+)
MKFGKFVAEMRCGGVALAEHSSSDKPGRGADSTSTVGYTLFHPTSFQMESEEEDPYGERYTQAWPVTPYTVWAHNSSPEAAWAEVFVDGRRSAMFLLKPQSEGETKGFQTVVGSDNGGYRPFVFSVPRQLRHGEDRDVAVDEATKSAIATVRVEFQMATYQGEAPHTQQASTFEDGVNKVVAKAAAAGSVSRPGPAVAGSRAKTAAIWSRGARLATLTFNYAAESDLKQRGIIPHDSDDEDAPPARDKKRKKATVAVDVE